MTLGERIAGLIRAKGTTARSVANTAGVNPSLITRCCTANRDLDVRRKTLESLASALDVSTDYLVGRRADLDDLDFGSVASREAFQIVKEERKLRSEECRRYEKFLALANSPRSAAEWRRFDDLRRLYNKSQVKRDGVTQGARRFGQTIKIGA